MPRVRNREGSDHLWYFMCPGCNGPHTVSSNAHVFNGNVDRPTFTPSVLVTGNIHTDEPGYLYDSKPIRCHSHIADGQIEFLLDCNHSLAGQTVELPDIP